ncbi:hypothetical protein RNI52_26405 [Labrys neptuniae]|uniref:hypothetical protein n=1 Tax=Labrys neptuniae TaxID=376174 RepID=UPI0028918E91|nr:hypothetical protein [Labrys neptuniae]MDT3380886.1 hypothetical protein [Labrys neptuniae]
MTGLTARYDSDEVELERETTLRDFQQWVIHSFGLQEQDDLRRRIGDEAQIKQMLSPIFDEMRDGDSLWLCRSIVLGPLLGHRGIALVRAGRPLIYLKILNY